MEFLQFTFPLSGVETFILIPPLVAFGISFFTSMGGISGAFLLLPYKLYLVRRVPRKITQPTTASGVADKGSPRARANAECSRC